MAKDTTESEESSALTTVKTRPSPSIARSLSTTNSSQTLSRIQQTLTRPFKTRKPDFHQFRNLPTEIRLQIWEASFEPRVHELHPCARLYNERMTFRSNSSKTPSIFHTCRESRMVALENYELMQYQPPQTGSGKGILRFYFCPKLDTLLLNSLMGLFIMFMLLEDEDDYVGVGVMKGWQRVAFDAERAQLISLLSGIAGHAPQPRFKAVFPSLQELIIAFDYTSKGKTRFRTSVWPGENGTTLRDIGIPLSCTPKPRVEEITDDAAAADESAADGSVLDNATASVTSTTSSTEGSAILDTIFRPMRGYLENEYQEDQRGIPIMKIAKVKRKAFIRGDIRYAFRKTCNFFHVRPRGPFRRL